MARIDFSKYKDMEPLYTEYNIGHYARSFALSSHFDRDKISANLEDGVLTLTLPKAQHAQPRKIRDQLTGRRRISEAVAP